MSAPDQVLMSAGASGRRRPRCLVRDGGGTGLRNARKDPQAVIRAIEQSDLRGMGGAGFPTHRKWAMIAAHKDCDKFVVCNGNEDEPGTFKDRFLLEHTPHQVIEGALIAAVATGANNVVIYVNPHETAALCGGEQAVDAWRARCSWREMAAPRGRPDVAHRLPLLGPLYRR